MKEHPSTASIFTRIAKRCDLVILTLGLLVVSHLPVRAQVEEGWVRTYNGGPLDTALAMAVDDWGDISVTGYLINSSNPDYYHHDFLTIKYLPDGTMAWEQRYEGPDDASDQASGIAVSPAGEVWVAGSSQPTNGPTTWVIIKYDVDGTAMWTNRLEGPDFVAHGSSPVGLAVDSLGNSYVAGSRNVSGIGEFVAAKYDPGGELIWVRFSGPDQDIDATAMVLDSMGNVAVTGNAIGSQDSSDMFTVKYSGDGTVIWSARYDGNGNDEPQYAAALCADANGNVFVTGTRARRLGAEEFLTVMYGPDGIVIWEATYAGPPGESYEGKTVQVDSGGNLYVTGPGTYRVGFDFRHDFSTVKYDPDGSQLWVARCEGEALGFGWSTDLLTLDALGNVYVGDPRGFTTVKYNTDGNFIWAISQAGSGASAMVAEVFGDYVLRTGRTRNTQIPSDDGDLLLVKYTPADVPSQPRAFVNPSGAESIVGSNATFSAVVNGPGPFTYQWRFNGRAITSATGAQLSLTNVPLSATGDYSVIVSNAASYTISPEARLVLHVPATITSRAETNTALVGESITFTVAAVGEPPLFYQWISNGVAILGATNSVLQLSNLQVNASGLYTVVVSNAFGVVVSRPYRLTVVPGSLGLTLKGSWPGYSRAPARDVMVMSNRAFVAMGTAGLVIFDVINPARPVRLGSHGTTDAAEKVHVEGDHAYVLQETRWTGSNYAARVEIFDITDPANPVLAGSFNTTSTGNDIAVLGSLAYIGSSDSLLIMDVSAITEPVRLGEYEADHFAVTVQVVDNYAFVANSAGGLQIVNVSNPASPRRVGTYPSCGGRVLDVAVLGNYAYLADSEQGLVILDVSNPENPKRVGGNGRPQEPRAVRVAGNRLYVLGTHWEVNRNVTELVVYDLNVPDDPVRLSKTEVESYGFPSGLDVAGNYVFVAAERQGLQVFDFSDPASPRLVSGGQTAGFARAVWVSGNRAYLADSFGGVGIIDVSNPTSLVLVGNYDTEGFALDVEVAGNRAYVAESDGLLIGDISNSANLVRLGRLGTSTDDGEYAAVQMVNQLAYLVDGNGDLQIINISDPTNIALVGTYAVTNGRAFGVHVANNRAYLVGTRPVDEDDSVGFLHILDVAQPANPTRLGQTDTVTYGNAVTLKGQFAFIAGQGVELAVLDVSDPANPMPVGQFDGPGSGENLQIAGNHAYVVGQSLGVLVVDVTDPAHPYRVAHYPFDNREDEDEGCDVQVVGNYAYVTRGAYGLLVFEITGRAAIRSVTRDGNNVVISWNGSPGLKLQRAASLNAGNWIDVSGSAGQSQATLSIAAGSEFFRLMKP